VEVGVKEKRKKAKPAPVSAPVPVPVPDVGSGAGTGTGRRSGDLATKVSASAGVIAAMVLAMLVNVFAARHYKRWDWTRGGLYTLS
jgi:hypothetical protein